MLLLAKDNPLWLPIAVSGRLQVARVLERYGYEVSGFADIEVFIYLNTWPGFGYSWPVTTVGTRVKGCIAVIQMLSMSTACPCVRVCTTSGYFASGTDPSAHSGEA